MIHTDGKPTIANNPYAAHRVVARAERLKHLETNCPCARCSEYDPDSAPGGYDNPSDPIDWGP